MRMFLPFESPDYRRCAVTLMDNEADPDIEFDENGVSNYVSMQRAKLLLRVPPPAEASQILQQMIASMKATGKNRRYDCVVGVSGGFDSSFVALKAKEFGLRILAVHFDNGWNSAVATSNIERLVKRLGIDLYTKVVDWEEFRDLQLSFLKSSTPDGEIPTDHGIIATLYDVAAKNDIPYILVGDNVRTEGIMPRSWAYGHLDATYIRSVHENYGRIPLKTYPLLTLSKLARLVLLKRLKRVALINYLPYDRHKTLNLLRSEIGWEDYGAKHHDSIYTKFYQDYFLPRKFGIDKRKAHLSALIVSGLAGRDAVMREFSAIGERVGAGELEFVLKKLTLTSAELNLMIKAPGRTFLEFENRRWLIDGFLKALAELRRRRLALN